MLSEIRLRTDAWHSDREITLAVPAEWDVTTYSPDTPPALSDLHIMETLAHPVGEPALRQLCSGKVSPLVIIDDLNRPTPTDRLLPFVLKEFAIGGIRSSSVRILLASGAHAPSTAEGVRRKLGVEAASACQILLHDPERGCTDIGRTSRGTPVMVNAEVLASDFILGIGGIYPNHTAGFGGGSKLALGVLGIRSIMHLHHRHSSIGWGQTGTNNTFRNDLDEIARMIKFRTAIAVHVNARREVVRMVCGDHFSFYRDEVQYARRMFSTPAPRQADVIISNAYPSDASLTFARMKGMLPIQNAAPGVSRIALASCSDGIGLHSLFPIERRTNPGRYAMRLMASMGPAQLIKKAVRRISRKRPAPQCCPAWLFRPVDTGTALPAHAGMKLAASWSDVLDAIRKEQAGKRNVRVVVYSCAPLQHLDERKRTPSLI